MDDTPSQDHSVHYLLQVHSPTGEVVHTSRHGTPKALAKAAHEITARGAYDEMGDDVDTYAGDDGIDYTDVEFSFVRLELHRLTEAEEDEIEAEIDRLSEETGGDTLFSKRRRARGFEPPDA